MALFNKGPYIKRVTELKREEIEITCSETTLKTALMGVGFDSFDGKAFKNAVYKYVVPTEADFLKVSGIELLSVDANSKASEIKNRADRAGWVVIGLSKDSLVNPTSFRVVKESIVTVGDFNKAESENISEFEINLNTSDLRAYKGTNLYLYVSCKSEKQPVVSAYKADRSELHLVEDPAASAVYEGDWLSDSKIHFANIMQGENLLSNYKIRWNESSYARIPVQGRDAEDFVEYEAVCLRRRFFGRRPIDSIKELKKRERVKTEPAKFEPKKHSLWRRLFSDLLVILTYSPVGRFKVKVPVYKKSDDRFKAIVWSKNLISSGSHRRYPSLMDDFALDAIFPNAMSLVDQTPEQAAARIARALLNQPEGYRCVSMGDNSVLVTLLGGALSLTHQVVKADYKARENVKDVDLSILPPHVREKVDYLASLSYFDNGEKYNDGFFFYEAPFHLDAPLFNPSDKTVLDECNPQLKILFADNQYVPDDGKNSAKGVVGGEVLRNLLHQVFGIVKNVYGIEVDYVVHDFEGIRSTINDVLKFARIDTKSDCWAHIWNRIKEGKYFKRLVDRGFVLGDSENLHPQFLELLNKHRKYHTNAYGLVEHNVDVWDQVFTEYFTEIFDEYAVAPIREFSPSVMATAHCSVEQRGYVSDCIGYDYESYRGGSVHLPEGFASLPNIYGQTSYIEKKMGYNNWKKDSSGNPLVDLTTPFTYLVGSINSVRAGLYRMAHKPVIPFVASLFYWTKQVCNGVGGGSDKCAHADLAARYYHELLIHAWLCNPGSMYAYLNYGDLSDDGNSTYWFEDYAPTEYKKITREEYDSAAYRAIQDVADELSELIGDEEFKSIPVKLCPKHSPFMLTGVTVRGYRLYRLTFDCNKSFEHLNKNEIKTSAEFSVDGCRILFRDANVLKESKFDGTSVGFWIKASCAHKPEITLDDSWKDFYGDVENYFKLELFRESDGVCLSSMTADSTEVEMGVEEQVVVDSKKLCLRASWLNKTCATQKYKVTCYISESGKKSLTKSFGDEGHEFVVAAYREGYTLFPIEVQDLQQVDYIELALTNTTGGSMPAVMRRVYLK